MTASFLVAGLERLGGREHGVSSASTMDEHRGSAARPALAPRKRRREMTEELAVAKQRNEPPLAADAFVILQSEFLNRQVLLRLAFDDLEDNRRDVIARAHVQGH